jgi:hypothetical protein
MFKEFGVRLNFTPTVLGGDLIHLKVRPEVSALDFANAIELEGFRIPALSTRRTETEIELRDGQTFAIAGLMNNTLTQSMGKIPGLGDIPILGYLFKSRMYQKNQTELVVMITPSIIRRGGTGVSEGLPSLVEPYLGPPSKTHANPDVWKGSPRYPVNQGTPRGNDNSAPAPAPTTNAPSSTAVPSRPITQQPVAPAPARTQPMPANPQPAPMKMVPSTTPTAPGSSTAPSKPASSAVAPALTQEQATASQKKSEADKRQADKLAKERAKREAEVAKKNAESARKQAEENQKREKSLNDAAARLKDAQSAYQSELQKAKGGSGDNKSAKSSSPSGAKQ